MAAPFPIRVDIEDALADGIARRSLPIRLGGDTDGTTNHWPLTDDRAEPNRPKNTAWKTFWGDLTPHLSPTNLLPHTPVLRERRHDRSERRPGQTTAQTAVPARQSTNARNP